MRRCVPHSAGGRRQVRQTPPGAEEAGPPFRRRSRDAPPAPPEVGLSSWQLFYKGARRAADAARALAGTRTGGHAGAPVPARARARLQAERIYLLALATRSSSSFFLMA